MLRKILSVFLLTIWIISAAIAQSADEKAIRGILDQQTKSWNKGDLVEFMSGYWNNDSLTFVGKSGVTYGYANTLNNYRKNYDSPAKMGQLKFDIVQVKKLDPSYYFVIGKWFLTRDAGNVGGHYTLIFRKINGSWKIISDHSS
jgi:ketosteroid isomerase-like protein